MARREGKVEFLGEQSGSVEETFKRDLFLEFATRPNVRRAYLAKVSFDSPNATVTAVCIVSTRPNDGALVVRVGEIVRRRFDKDSAFEVLFLTAEQEADVARVCRPFYSTSS